MAKILLVDDELPVLSSLATLMSLEGHEAVTENDGEKACELLKNETFDILITDIRMEPMDGLTLMKLAREAQPGIKMLAISAYHASETAEALKKLDASGFIRKPFRIDDVISAVKEALAS